jgi:gliding motility-associated-like protein
LNVFEAATAIKPENINFCDIDNDGLNLFDLKTSTTPRILGILNPSNFEVLYFKSLTDANAGENPLVIPYENPTPFSSQIIYARVQNKKAPASCFALTEFDLNINSFPIPNEPEPYRICDDSESGLDTDGIIRTFLLRTQDALILDKYNVSYHTTQIGAETNTSSTRIDKNKNYTVNAFKTVFVRVENALDAACYDASKTLDLIVDPLPILKLNPELEQCISSGDTNPTVNLTNSEFSVSEDNGATFTYFEDAAATIEITNETSYPVMVNVPQSVFVRVTSLFNCSRTPIELKLNIAQTEDNPYDALQPAACDDFLDAAGNNTPGMNDDSDFITNFYLDKIEIENGINPPENTTVFYYENPEDRNNAVNEIDITNYRNKINKINSIAISEGIRFPIYYKILSTLNSNCKGLGEIYLQINKTPKASSNILSPIQICDTGANDNNNNNGSNEKIDLTQKIDELFDGTGQDKEGFDVTFYTTELGAFFGDNNDASYIDTPTEFTNDIPLGFSPGSAAIQQIYVRVSNKISGCAYPRTSFNIIINPLPILRNPLPALPVCDLGIKDGNMRNGLAQNIKVSERDLDIVLALEYLENRVATDFIITYHKTQADADDLNTSGINKNSYDSDPTRVNINANTKISEELLFIRIIDSTTGCLFKEASLILIVNPKPTAEPISELSQCDNFLMDADDTNGSVPDINLDEKISEILGTSQDPSNFIVTFHNSSTDAFDGSNPITSPYTNTKPTEIIYVRIKNKATACVNADASFDLVINSLPDFDVTSPQIFCLNNPPLNIIIEYESAAYAYEWRNSSGTVISMPYNANDLSGGNYSVTATTTDGTNCSKTKTIVVNESNSAILKPSFVRVLDEGNALGNDTNLSIIIDVVNNDIGSGNYQFALLKEDREPVRIPSIGFQDSPIFEYLEGGIYTIIVNDKNGCTPDAILKVSVLSFPKFFTPNGDNNNDTWSIRGATKDFYKSSTVKIFNRYGKLIAQINRDGEGWDGTYNGKKLSSDDYWFNMVLVPVDASKPSINKTGNFSLLRK